MANHKDAIKRHKQNQKARARNRHYRSMMRNQTKHLRSLVEEGKLEEAQEALRKATGTIQRLASKGIIHRNQAARRVGRLASAVKKLAVSASAS